MQKPLTMNTVQSILEFPFKQPNGTQKIIVGAALTLLSFVVPILPGLVVTGYQAAIARRAIRTGELVMPEWDDWSTLLLDGLKVTGVLLIYLAPAILTFIFGYTGMMFTSVGAAIVEDNSARELVPFMPILMLGTFGGIALLGVGLVLVFAAGLVLPAALMHMVATDSFAAAFRVREWGGLLRANLGGFLLGYVLLLGLSFVFSFVTQILYLTIILCCLMPVVMAVYSMYMGTIGSALFGQVYREALAKRDALPPAVPPAPPAPALPAEG
jgi:hypothetical protein